MPRAPDPANEKHQMAQRRYRERLQATRTPEAPAVDAALAKAVSGYATVVQADGLDPETLKGLLTGAVRLLADDGYDRKAAARKVQRRVGRRGSKRIAAQAGMKANR